MRIPRGLSRFLFALAALAVVFPIGVSAASLTVSPTEIDFQAEPGQQTSVRFMATNAGTTPIAVEIEVENFRLPPGATNPEFLSMQRDVGPAAWAEYVHGPIVIRPGEIKPIGVTLTVPTQVPSGGAYGAIFLKASDGERPVSGAAIEERVGVLLFGTIGQVAPVIPTLSRVQMHRDSSLSAPRSFSLSLTNASATHVVPQGVVVVSDGSGERRVSFPINNDGRRLMPGMMRNFSVGWRDAGYGESLGMSTLHPGFHRYDVLLAGGKGPLSTVASGRFLVLPMKYLVGVGIVLFLLLFAAVRAAMGHRAVASHDGAPPGVPIT